MYSIHGFSADEQERFRNRTLRIHRYMSVSRLFELLRSKKLLFVDPSVWPDPFESFMGYAIEGAKRAEAETGGFCYFSCWTRASESDHLWRLYTPNTDGVRITVDVHALVKTNPHWVVRKVSYLPVVNIKSRIAKHRKLLLEASLRHFIKRIAFKAEQEVRLMVRDPSSGWDFEDGMPQPFDPKLVTQILFDPRMDPEMFTCLSSYLRSTYSLAIQMKHSHLYQPEKIFGAQPPLA